MVNFTLYSKNLTKEETDDVVSKVFLFDLLIDDSMINTDRKDYYPVVLLSNNKIKIINTYQNYYRKD